MNEITRLFGNRAGAYAHFRPQYPSALFTWLASNSPARERALDIACGNGQASRPLLEHFHQVLACDGSPEQLRAAPDLQGIDCFAADASAQPLPAASLDLITVAQALHWFATPAFFAEVQRLLRPGGLFCAWCYSLLRIDAEVDALLDDFYWNTLQGWWPAGRASVDAGYQDIQLPFERIHPPALSIELQWDLNQLVGYLSTWSAVQKLAIASGHDPLQALLPKLTRAWGDRQKKRFVYWPLHFLAGFPIWPTQRQGDAMNDELQHLKNLGKTSAQWLHAVGIHSANDLRRLGAVDAYRAVRARGFRASKVLLYAIEGALLNVHWNDLPPGLKDRLNGQLDERRPGNKS